MITDVIHILYRGEKEDPGKRKKTHLNSMSEYNHR